MVSGDDELTPYGGIVAFDHFLNQTGIIKILADNYPKPRTSPNATPVGDILKGMTMNFLLGGTRFAHQRRLQDDRAVAQIFGLERGRINGEDAFRRLTEKLEKEEMRFEGFSSRKAVVAESASRLLLIVYNLWSLFVRVLSERDGHTEAVTSRYELLMLPGRFVKSGRQKTVKLSIGEKLRNHLKAAYTRLQE